MPLTIYAPKSPLIAMPQAVQPPPRRIQIADFTGGWGRLVLPQVAAFNWWSSGADASTFATIDATGGRNSTPAIKIQATAAAVSSFGFLGLAQRTTVAGCWVKVNQNPTLAAAGIIQGTGGTTSPVIQLTTAGVL